MTRGSIPTAQRVHAGQSDAPGPGYAGHGRGYQLRLVLTATTHLPGTLPARTASRQLIWTARSKSINESMTHEIVSDRIAGIGRSDFGMQSN